MPESGMSQSSQNFFRSLDGIGQLFLRMGSRNEHCLKLCRRQSDPLLKHPGKIPGIGLEVASLGVHESRDGSRREERRTQTLNVVDLNGGSGFLCGPGSVHQQERTLLGKLRVDLGVILEIMQLGKARRHGHGIAAEGSGLIDRAAGSHLLHQCRLPAVSAHGHTAADDLAEGNQIRMYPVVSLRAAQGQAETGDDLIEHQQSSALVTQLSQPL